MKNNEKNFNEQLMYPANWEDQFRTGITVIDEQHKRILAMINALYEACYAEKNAEKAHDLAYTLSRYFEYHFATEEKILELINYPDIDWHKDHHNIAKQKVTEVIQQHEKAIQNKLPDGFVYTLKEWILTHLTVYDQDYGEFFKKSGGAQVEMA